MSPEIYRVLTELSEAEQGVDKDISDMMNELFPEYIGGAIEGRLYHFLDVLNEYTSYRPLQLRYEQKIVGFKG